MRCTDPRMLMLLYIVPCPGSPLVIEYNMLPLAVFVIRKMHCFQPSCDSCYQYYTPLIYLVT